MIKLKKKQLFSKLSGIAYRALESATALCKTRGNPSVDIAHYLNQILLGDPADFHEIIRYYGIDEARLSADLVKALDTLPRGASAISGFSPLLETAIQEGWMAASIVYQSPLIRTGHLLLAIKLNPDLSRRLHEISSEMVKINGDLLQEKFLEITGNSPEAAAMPSSGDTGTGQVSGLMNESGLRKGEALDLYTTDMTALAREGKIDGIVGRDEEIRKMLDVLLRRRQNNPILTGEAGVGKTAVVEGFAVRLAKGDVPDCLKGTVLRSLDMGLLQAGASMKGEFENRLKQVIEEVKSSDVPIILFIDEAHTLIGAGGAAGQNDAANLIKPALARGELRCIAATTYREYVKYFEKDPALTRRFENILVQEPDDEKAFRMLRAMTGFLEKYHHVRILDEAVKATVTLSRRYIPTRQLPDKGVSVLDTACAKVALSQSTLPAEIEFLGRKLESLRLEKDILSREDQEGFNRAEELEAVQKLIDSSEKELSALKERHDKISALAKNYLDLRNRLSSQENGAAPTPEDRDLLQKTRDELNELQGDSPMVLPEVDEQAVSSVISEWTGIPLGRMVKNEISSVLSLGDHMQERVIGQDQGVSLIAKRILTARAALADPDKPIAVIMLAGPSGVGKTETALALAEQLYGTENNLITINMSEFQEAHTVSTLKGAPPGYVGYGEGGVLTEAVRRRPYSVVLLDEIEKAHRDVHEIFFQVFDKGRMEDGSGRLINFRNCVIILTTNVGDDKIIDLCPDESALPSPETLAEAIRPDLMRVFPAALLGRITVVPYYPLGTKAINRIIDLKLNKVVKRVRDKYRAEFICQQGLRDEIIRRCDNVASGARLIDAVINNDLLPDVSAKFLEFAMAGKELAEITADAKDGKFVFEFTEKAAS
ncbi:type VI secretion system ATPase TssH [Succinimonas sp.]|uniref:type VI secretion system ATPase TssH n=1 Tax=Succinimonas sp. TaxID=1936151 RepID=UPI0038634945